MASPLKTLIVDDEPLAIERLETLCSRLPQLEKVGTASNGEEALRMISQLEPDLLLLDIAMPKLDGIGVAKAAGQLKSPPAVIFVTAFDGFAVEAFNLAAIDYVLKPVSPDRLTLAIERVVERRKTNVPLQSDTESEWATEFWVPHKSELMRISACDIDRIEAERDYMQLHVGSRSYLLHQTITTLEERLDPAQFIRLHRSHIVRRDWIAGLRHDGGGVWLAMLKCGREIRIGRTHLAAAKKIAGR